MLQNHSIALLFLITAAVSAQTTNISGVINIYTPVTGFDSCSNTLTVFSAAGFSVGDTVLIIQMKGATTDITNTAAFGTINSYNEAGNYESAVISGITGNDLTFVNRMANKYNPAGRAQVVSVPQYVNADVTGTLTAQAWNGSTGGVLIFQASGTVTLNANINVDALGFRGGAYVENLPNGCSWASSQTAYYYSSTDWRGAYKGEGIADFTAGRESGRGPQANGGGGGNDHNAGGAGGGNYGTGGAGGRNNEPGAFNCKGYYPGLGGKLLNYASGKVFLGGGGGSGHGNNASNSRGGNGGGIAIIIADNLDGNGLTIRANGENGFPSWNDGAGGGGAGGTILLEVNNIGATALTLLANGGNGADANNIGNRCYGPGGGGGGGTIYSIGALPVSTGAAYSGGANGLTRLSTNACNNTALLSTSGQNGGELTGLSIPRGTIPYGSCTPLPVTITAFHAVAVQDKVRLEWTTLSENNSSHFIVERLIPGSEPAAWEPVGSLEVSGSSRTPRHYALFDAYPYDGQSYYRLKQIGFDGHADHFGPAAVIFYSQASMLEIRPNPAPSGEPIHMLTRLNESSGIRITLFNTLGQTVYLHTGTSASGETRIEIHPPPLRPGLYILSVSSAYATLTRRLIISERR